MAWTKALIFLAVIITVSAQEHEEQISEKQMADCLEEGDFQCMKLRALANVYKLLKAKSFELADGVTVEYSGDKETREESARALVDQDWGSLFFGFVPRLMNNLSLKLNIFPGGNFVVSRGHNSNGFVDMSIEADKGVVEGRKYFHTNFIIDILVIASTNYKQI